METETKRALIERLARARGHEERQLAVWRCRGRVPHHARLALARDAEAEGARLTDDDFDSFDEAGGRWRPRDRPPYAARPRRAVP